ncbi:hypothetical protein BJV77DRAFT_964021 [Russula vinacea]|nr:hypothetical protein BJV77DRAFT_964021 [Russula vinacea]
MKQKVGALAQTPLGSGVSCSENVLPPELAEVAFENLMKEAAWNIYITLQTRLEQGEVTQWKLYRKRGLCLGALGLDNRRDDVMRGSRLDATTTTGSANGEEELYLDSNSDAAVLRIPLPHNLLFVML